MPRDPELDAVICDCGLLLTNQELGNLLGISPHAARYRRYRLGLIKSSPPLKLSLDPDEVDLFFALFQTERLRFIAEIFGLSIRQVRHKAIVLGWKRPASYYNTHPSLLHHNYPPELREVIRLNNQLRKALGEQYRCSARASIPPTVLAQ